MRRILPLGALVLFLAGCGGSSPTSPGSAPVDHVQAGTHGAGGGWPLPDLAVGNTWIYDVVIRRRSRPQDGSRPWTEWSTSRVERRATGTEVRVLDGLEYIVIQESNRPIDPPGDVQVRRGDPHRRDFTGLYHRPSGIRGQSPSGVATSPEAPDGGGPVGGDVLLVPHPAIPGREFASTPLPGEVRVVEGREAIPTGLGRIPTARVRTVSGDGIAPTDVLVDWFAPQGRVASSSRRIRAGLGPGQLPDRERLWIEVETTEILRDITFSE